MMDTGVAALLCKAEGKTKRSLVEQIYQPFQVPRLEGQKCLQDSFLPWAMPDLRLLIKASRTEPTSHVVSFISCLFQGALCSQGFKAQSQDS